MKNLDYTCSSDQEDKEYLLSTIAKRHLPYCEVGDNLALDCKKAGGFTLTDGDKTICNRRYVFFIVEGKRLMSLNIEPRQRIFMTNDTKKFEKFKKYAEAYKFNKENGLDIPVSDLDGKIFPGRDERDRMLTEGMFL